MWKKIIYYVSMIVIGILLMIVSAVSLINSRYKKLINYSIKHNDYSNVLGIYTTYSNTNALEGNMTLSDNEAKAYVFETASQRATPDGEKTRDYLDIEYTIVLVGNYRKNSNQQAAGKNFNKCGFTITNSLNETFTYYDNKYADGVITGNDDDKLYGDYDLKLDTQVNLKIFVYSIPYQFLVKYSGLTEFDIANITVSDNVGSEFMSFTPTSTLNYQSETHNKINELIPYFNAAVKNSSKDKELSNFYKTWKPEFLSIDGTQLAMKNNKIFNGGFWFKLIGTGVLYILFVFILADFTIGRRRILYMIQGGARKGDSPSFDKKNINKNKPVSNTNTNNNVIDADIIGEKQVEEDSEENAEN